MKLGLSLIAALAVLICTASSAPSAHAGVGSDSSCVKTEQRDDLEHSQIVLDFTNDCSGSRVCNVTWSVTCERKTKAHKAAISLTTKEVKALTLSAAACDGEWAIQPPSWSCRSSSSK